MTSSPRRPFPVQPAPFPSPYRRYRHHQSQLAAHACHSHRKRDLHSTNPASEESRSGGRAGGRARWGRIRPTRRCRGRGWAPPPAPPAKGRKTAWSVPFLTPTLPPSLQILPCAPPLLPSSQFIPHLVVPSPRAANPIEICVNADNIHDLIMLFGVFLLLRGGSFY
jgi:hypothetical protein